MTSPSDKHNAQDFVTSPLLPQKQTPSSWRSDWSRTDRLGRWYSMYQWSKILHNIKIIPLSPSTTIATIYYANITSSSAVFILRNPLSGRGKVNCISEKYPYIPKTAVDFKQSNCQKNTICWSILSSCWSLWHVLRKLFPQGHSVSEIPLLALQRCCQN